MKRRTLALAGLAQAVEAVLQVANDGDADPGLLEVAIDSLFVIDADSTEAVYGGLPRLRSGLQILLSQLRGSQPRQAAANRIAFTVLLVERKLAAHPGMLAAITAGIESIRPRYADRGALDPDVQQRLGDLYAATLSKLSPRVLVQGNPAQLSQTAVVARIRALLLAAVRSAVLWRQVGGGWWDLLLRRGRIGGTVQALLQPD